MKVSHNLETRMSDNVEEVKNLYELIKAEQKKGEMISRISVVTVILIFAIPRAMRLL